MNTPIRLLLEARAEFDEAADWYQRQRAGLGQTFIAQIREALDRIAADPQRHAVVYQDVRKVLVRTFPYAILHREEAGEVLVISVIHTSRHPSVWRSRG